MTKNNSFKKQIRARMKKTGETYKQAYDALYKAPDSTQTLAYLAQFGLAPMNSFDDKSNITLEQFFSGPTLSSMTAHLTDPRCGLILFTGKTASGKTLLMNASIGTYLNHCSSSRFIALDDTGHPETVINPKYPYAISLSNKDEMTSLIFNAIRMRPDMITLGEIRYDEIISHASWLAGTGHPTMATLHANTLADAIERMGKVDDISMVIMQERFKSGVGILALRYALMVTPEIRSVLRDYLKNKDVGVLHEALEALGAPTLETQKERMVAAGILASVSSNTILNKPENTSIQNGQDQ